MPRAERSKSPDLRAWEPLKTLSPCFEGDGGGGGHFFFLGSGAQRSQSPEPLGGQKEEVPVPTVAGVPSTLRGPAEHLRLLKGAGSSWQRRLRQKLQRAKEKAEKAPKEGTESESKELLEEFSEALDFEVRAVKNLTEKTRRLRFLQRTLALVGSENSPETSNLRSCSICYEDNLDTLPKREGKDLWCSAILLCTHLQLRNLSSWASRHVQLDSSLPLVAASSRQGQGADAAFN